MAVGAKIQGDGSSSNTLVCAASVKTKWTVVHDDLTATAETSTVLLQPWSSTTSSLHWVRVPDGCTRVMVRARKTNPSGNTATSPIVQIWGADGTPDANGAYSGTPGAANFSEFTRLDASAANGTGITLTLTSGGTGMTSDATYAYSNPADLTGIDCKGCHWIAMLTATAASVTSASVVGQFRFIN